ncbi:hypothetical protein RR48_00262, partial [Papilio machaon]
ESWHDPKASESSSVINILDIGRQNFANGGVVSRYLCDLAQCVNLVKYDYKDVVPSVVKDERFQRAIDDTTQEEMRKSNGTKPDGVSQSSHRYTETRRKVEARAMKVLMDISSAMSNNVLRLVYKDMSSLFFSLTKQRQRYILVQEFDYSFGYKFSCTHIMKRDKRNNYTY